MDSIDLVVTSRIEEPWAIVNVEGEVDMFTAPKLRERLVQLVDEGRHQIIVDLQSVTFIDSMGLGTLVGALKRVKENQGTLALVCSHRPVMRVLTITGLNNVFPIYATLDEATAASAS